MLPSTFIVIAPPMQMLLVGSCRESRSLIILLMYADQQSCFGTVHPGRDLEKRMSCP